ncbi:AAA family ATPase [Spirosoma sp. HMF4905]|uniref:AAA family ATPase n=1 Tax=Spirosoma arboris TaxID=2682092 RepID=A0A7K1SFS6_9BACT|nr:AAA family ATPase [Spirosoma arboris]MVM32584.1 AAA family ATPase [Spirosoma arboris]
MKIKRLVIENFKSIERIELIEPNPFTVFVGPNGSGKSNIFEALEFAEIYDQIPSIAVSLFGGIEALQKRNGLGEVFQLHIDFQTSKENTLPYEVVFNFDTYKQEKESKINDSSEDQIEVWIPSSQWENSEFQQFHERYSRLFIKNDRLVKLPLDDNKRLSLSAKNLEKVLKRLLSDNALKIELFEWLELFVPSFKNVEVDYRNELHWFEEFMPSYFTKDLISDGTYNILAILTAIYQSDEPQFLCIEEPENGLNPKVVKELVNLCRYACEEFGHYIWLNTHSQTLVAQLTPDEIILVDKNEGATQTKQIKGMNLHDLPMDEAWLSNALGGGLPW